MRDFPFHRQGRLIRGRLVLLMVGVMALTAVRVIAAPATQPAAEGAAGHASRQFCAGDDRSPHGGDPPDD